MKKAKVSRGVGHVAFQFNIEGEAEGAFYVELADGNVNVEPKVTLNKELLTKNLEDLSGQIPDKVIQSSYYIEDNQLILQPENSAYRPFVYVNEQINDVRILGKAVWFASKVK